MNHAAQWLIAAALLVLLLPLLAAAALLVVLDSRGGALFVARRVGRSGVEFGMLKLRTMVTAASSASSPRGAITEARDPRVTRVGRLLRRTHIDEWPQLWNVLRGEMNLVGPRPEDPLFVDAGDVAWQRVLSVRPGITGTTQLAFAARESELLTDAAADTDGVYRRDVLPAKLALDLEYVASRSTAGDMGVLLRTAALPLIRGRRTPSVSAAACPPHATT